MLVLLNPQKFCRQTLHNTRQRVFETRYHFFARGTARPVISAAGDSQDDDAPAAWQQTFVSEKLIPFVGPVACIAVSEPLMGLLSTMFIGTNETTKSAELAALGPAGIVFGFSIYALQALSMATLRTCAVQLQESDPQHAQQTFSSALTLAIVFGTAITAILCSMAEPLIQATGASDPNIVAYAVAYVKIRAAGHPLMLLSMVAQAGLLAQRNAIGAMLAVLCAMAVSILGHFAFVGKLGLGIAGAAFTTVISTAVGATAMMVSLESSGKLKPTVSLTTLQSLVALAHIMAPLAVTYLFRNVSYLVIQGTAATLDVVRLAAHQSVFALWNFGAFAISPAEQAAVTYIPAAKQPWQRRAIKQTLLLLGCCSGIVMGGLVLLLVSLAPQLFTKDAAIWPFMGLVICPAFVAMVLTGTDSTANGINIAAGDADYVARSYVVTLAATGVFMWLCRYYQWGLQGVWWGLVCFFGVRALQSMWLVLTKHLKVDSSGMK